MFQRRWQVHSLVTRFRAGPAFAAAVRRARPTALRGAAGASVLVALLLAAPALLGGCANVVEPPPGRASPSVSWHFVDGNAASGINYDSTHNGHYPQLLAFNGELYNTWYEDPGSDSQIRIAKLVPSSGGDGWQFVDGAHATGINRDPAEPALWSRLVAFDGKLYCYWYEHLADSTTTIRVAVYNGNPVNPVWSYVDGTLAGGLRYDPTGRADYAVLEPLNGKLYAAWRETDSNAPYQIRVAVYNGNDSSPAWAFVDRGAGGGINYNTSLEGYYPKLTAYNGKLYIIWYELNGTARTIHCAVYNGDDSNPVWTIIGGNAADGLNFNPLEDAHGPQLLVANTTLYATWYEIGPDLISHIRFMRYNGDDTSPSWKFIDGDNAGGLNRDPAQDAWWTRATATGNDILDAWTESAGNVYLVHVSLLDIDSGNWYAVDGPNGMNHDPRDSAEYSHMATMDGVAYLTWSERHNGVLQVRVVKGEVK